MRVLLPSSGIDAYGWALDSTPSEMGAHQGYKVRIQFTEPLAGLAKKR
jgi:hypothetical protein